MDDISKYCEKDEDGNIIEPVFGNVIPPSQAIVVGKTCMDKQFLIEHVIFNRPTNPFTEVPLDDDTLLKLEEYRNSRLITLHLFNKLAAPLSKRREQLV